MIAGMDVEEVSELYGLDFSGKVIRDVLAFISNCAVKLTDNQGFNAGGDSSSFGKRIRKRE
jgi:hypothetical protein